MVYDIAFNSLFLLYSDYIKISPTLICGKYRGKYKEWIQIDLEGEVRNIFIDRIVNKREGKTFKTWDSLEEFLYKDTTIFIDGYRKYK